MKKNKTYYNNPILPEIGKRYICYDDGKIRPSRAVSVVIKDIKKLSECSEEIKNLWKEEAEQCTWLGMDKFKEPIILVGEMGGNARTVYYAPCVHEYERVPFWFGFGTSWDDGWLDVDGSLTKSITNSIKKGDYTYPIEEWEKDLKELLEI